MDNPFVSVILPNYNHARYLDQRIQSVLNQTYQHFELIILDDKSPDNSVEVMEKYRTNSHVSHIVINEVNSGSTFVQWHKGFGLAKGDLIWIAESDDYCEPELLEKLINAYQSYPECVVAYCSSQYVDSEGILIPTIQEEKVPVLFYKGKDFIAEKLAFGCAIWNASSALFDKKTALSLDRQYQDYKACGDRLFWMEMAEKGNIVHVNSFLNYFRQHQNKVSPKRFRDGTSLHEEYQINQYQRKNHYLSGWRRIFILSLYYDKINEGEFLNQEVKDELMHLWEFENKPKVAVIKLLARLYIYYRLYVLHKNPL